ncbi:cell wall metabolism sensor histidine kinase WalK [Andreprevotia sp. IGB-42]|uniref:sensor histidine kinase n=1 Tax=Andreprevotia sp. IGB-42 TaxID=2497473 RepID=UPI00135B9E7E|nr:HAMP domain-containing sensor histidine kinase [Andreprevotia sp. IGB-42]
MRWRLAWSFTILTAVAVLVLAVAVFWASEELEEDLIDEIVNTALEDVIRHPQSPPALPPHMQLFHAPVGVAPAGLPAEVFTMHPGNHEWFNAETEFHLGIRDQGGQRFYLLYDTREHEARLAWLLTSLVVGVLVLSVLALWFGQWLAGVLLQPLARLTQGVREDHPQPFSAAGQDEEVALLAEALDRYRLHNRNLIAREREFTANVSHELRTPLTRIRTSAELLADAPAVAERALRIIAGVDALERRLQGLLFLAREGAAPHPQPVQLQVLVAQLLGPHQAVAAARGLLISNRVPADVQLHADPALLAMVIDNLLGNAVRYTPDGEIVIDCADGVLSVQDSGEGIPPEQLPHVFERHYRASRQHDGSGLGLAIVERVASLCGWRCAIDSTPGVGTTVRVHFTPQQ